MLEVFKTSDHLQGAKLSRDRRKRHSAVLLYPNVDFKLARTLLSAEKLHKTDDYAAEQQPDPCSLIVPCLSPVRQCKKCGVTGPVTVQRNLPGTSDLVLWLY